MKINFDLVESGERVEFNLKDTKVVNTGGGVSENRVVQIVKQETADLQPQVDEGLSTENKNIVGAINEVNDIATEKTAVLVDGQKVNEFNADEKFDKTGGVVGGDVTIQGNLYVSGENSVTNTETLRVKDNVIVANDNGVKLVENGGFAIKTNEAEAYGIMYDPFGDGVKIGLGGFTEDGKFVYNEGEEQFLATRADTLMDGHIPKWDNEKKQFVDSGVGHDEVVKFTDKASDNTAGLLETYYNKYSSGIEFLAGKAKIYGAKKNDIDNKSSDTLPITPSTNEYSTMSALADCKDTTLWTDNKTVDGEYIIGTKQKARNLLGAVGFTDYTTSEKAGVGLVAGFQEKNATGGILLHASGKYFTVRRATNDIIDARTPNDYIDNGIGGANRTFPICPANLDYAVMSALANSKDTDGTIWKDEAKAKACETIGAVPKTTKGLQIYGTDSNGNQVAYNYRYSNNTKNTVAGRDGNGNIQVGTAVNKTDCVNLQYAEDNFVPKTSLSTYSLEEGTVPVRDASGGFDVGEPLSDDSCTPRWYVEQQKGTKLYLHRISHSDGDDILIINRYSAKYTTSEEVVANVFEGSSETHLPINSYYANYGNKQKIINIVRGVPHTIAWLDISTLNFDTAAFGDLSSDTVTEL